MIDSDDQLDGIIEIAFGQGVHPRKGFELLLKTHGICRAITFFGQCPDPKSREQGALLLLRALHGELVDNLKHAISRTEGQRPDGNSVTDLIRGRDWLFGDFDSYVDIAHLTAIVPLALDFTDPEALQLALELCDYGTHLSTNFQYRTDPPFQDFYNDHAIYLRALAGCEIDAAIGHFRGKVGDPTAAATAAGPAQILVLLLTRLKRYAEASRDWQRAIDLDDGPAQDHLRLFLEVARLEEKLKMLAKPRGQLLFAAARLCAQATSSASATKESGLQKHYAKRTLDLLKQTRTAGYFSDELRIQQFKKDSTFEPLRQNEKFQAFVKSLEAQ